MPNRDAAELYMIAVEQYIRHRDRALARDVDTEAIEGVALSVIVRLESERAKIDQGRRDGWVRNILTVLVGLFIVVLPSISRLSFIAASWAGKQIPQTDDFWMNITTTIGVLAILGLQCPLILPLVEHLIPRKLPEIEAEFTTDEESDSES